MCFKLPEYVDHGCVKTSEHYNKCYHNHLFYWFARKNSARKLAGHVLIMCNLLPDVGSCHQATWDVIACNTFAHLPL